ncbi:hypothetical protein D3C72_2452330 [compost metagenome]
MVGMKNFLSCVSNSISRWLSRFCSSRSLRVHQALMSLTRSAATACASALVWVRPSQMKMESVSP